MGRNRLVVPKIVRLPLSDDDYIDVKEALNAGEYRDLIADMSAESHFGESPKVDMRKVGITKVLQYLLGWSFCGPDNSPIPYSADMSEDSRIATLRSLDTETYREVRDAIDQHEERIEAERSARKNGNPGATNLSPTAP